jgi:hypothetical protein
MWWWRLVPTETSLGMTNGERISCMTPTLGVKAAELEAASKDEAGRATKKWRERDRKRAVYFKVGFCNYWRTPIHKTIRKVKARFPSLTWL